MAARIESLKLVGFKSFAEETELRFTKRFVAIVGPNGSGKSNIVDALRWVLGDHSFRMLRISEPTDLIYQGEKRKSNFATVSLTIVANNESHVLERKINRRGEINYFLNGQEIKFKQLVEFLATLKIGTKGLTVINQGLSDIFIRSSPKERYEILNEMFGTKLLEIKKKEAISNLQTAVEKYNQLEKEIYKLKPILDLYEKEKNKKDELESLQSKLQKIDSQIEEKQMLVLFFQKKEIEEKLQILEDDLKRIKEEKENLISERPEISEEKLNQLQKQKILLLEQRNKLLESNSQKTKNFNLEEIKKILEEILKIQEVALIHKKVKEILEMLTAKYSPPKEIENLDQQLKELSQQISLIEDDLKDKKKKAELINKKLQELERKIIGLEIEREQKMKSLKEIEEKLSNFKPKEFHSKLNLEETIAEYNELLKEKKEIEEKIWSLGALNLEVLQEGEKLLNKYQDVLADLENVNKSITELKEKIENYESQIKTTFKAYLEKINLDLEKYFHEFFGPGELKLKLNGEEIHLHFYHRVKNIKTLESLSGGERALISIIVIFALIQISEPPFLILDEIDAPLDEKNARKFVELIKQLCYRTQFIVVTHNRITMENAEAIYGVSLEKDGISKIFSLKLKSEEQNLV